MANSKSSSGVRNLMYPGKHAHALLPPKSPFPSISQAYADYVSNPTVGPKPVNKPREGNAHHQRTSSESHLIEEQPSWLDDLLNEPDTPVRRGGHRRSSSDSFAYIDNINASNINYADHDEYKYKNLSIPAWSPPDFDRNKDARHVPMYAEINAAKQKNRSWDSFSNMSGVPSGKDNVAFQRSGSPTPCTLYEPDRILLTANENHDSLEAGVHAKNHLLKERMVYMQSHLLLKQIQNVLNSNLLNGHRSVNFSNAGNHMKYIAELERNVQALQAEGSEVSAELEFLNQQNLILSMEDKALKQRLESLAWEQLIKYCSQAGSQSARNKGKEKATD